MILQRGNFEKVCFPCPGGNVVGIEAAWWRWFGHDPKQMIWAETTTLAVLPNSPSLIHPGKNKTACCKREIDYSKTFWLPELSTIYNTVYHCWKKSLKNLKNFLELHRILRFISKITTPVNVLLLLWINRYK